jgi:hypothetical protein
MKAPLDTKEGTDILPMLNGAACYRNTMTVALTDNGLSDTITATAYNSPNPGATQLTDSDSATAECPALQISPALSVTKDCTVGVEVKNGLVAAKVSVAGQVCNIGDTTLNNVKVEDLGIATSPAPLLSGKTLNAPADRTNPTVAEGVCLTYGSYFPSSVNSSDPDKVKFEDTVEATADDIFGDPVKPQTIKATCYLCPPEPAPGT